MIRKILYVPEIIDDLADAREWYESRSDGLGEEFRFISDLRL